MASKSQPTGGTDDAPWTLEEADAAREERGIYASHFGIVIGYSTQNGWYNAVHYSSISDEKLRKAKAVIEYYDDHGIIPTPGEISSDGGEGDV